MSGTTMIVLIVFISVGFGVIFDMYSKHLKYKEKVLRLKQNTNEENDALKQQITKLTARVETLEKIVTDEGYTVSKEINQL